ncbi:MAG: hypothetical protein AB7D46_11460 [Flavobacteriaceae bacterium]
MINEIISQGKELLSGKLKEAAGLNDSQIDTTIETAGESTIETLKNEVTGGNLKGVLDLFNGKSETSKSNPIVDEIAKNFISSLVSKLGVGEGVASKASDVILPFIMSKFSSKETGKAKDGSQLMSLLGLDGGDITGAFGNLLGENKGKNLLGKLGKMF